VTLGVARSISFATVEPRLTVPGTALAGFYTVTRSSFYAEHISPKFIKKSSGFYRQKYAPVDSSEGCFQDKELLHRCLIVRKLLWTESAVIKQA